MFLGIPRQPPILNSFGFTVYSIIFYFAFDYAALVKRYQFVILIVLTSNLRHGSPRIYPGGEEVAFSFLGSIDSHLLFGS